MRFSRNISISLLRILTQYILRGDNLVSNTGITVSIFKNASLYFPTICLLSKQCVIFVAFGATTGMRLKDQEIILTYCNASLWEKCFRTKING